jgi:hypothetical protein
MRHYIKGAQGDGEGSTPAENTPRTGIGSRIPASASFLPVWVPEWAPSPQRPPTAPVAGLPGRCLVLSGPRAPEAPNGTGDRPPGPVPCRDPPVAGGSLAIIDPPVAGGSLGPQNRSNTLAGTPRWPGDSPALGNSPGSLARISPGSSYSAPRRGLVVRLNSGPVSRPLSPNGSTVRTG